MLLLPAKPFFFIFSLLIVVKRKN